MTFDICKMYVKVRNAMTGDQVMVTASKLTSVAEIKEQISKKYDTILSLWNLLNFDLFAG